MVMMSREPVRFRTDCRKAPRRFASAICGIVVALVACAAPAQDDPNGAAPPADPANAGDAQTAQALADEAYTEVVVLSINGVNPWQRLVVEDLDVLTLADGRRLLPLHRLLKLLEGESNLTETSLAFQFERGPATRLDLQTGQVAWDSSTDDVLVIDRVSEITGEREVYVPPDVVSRAARLDFQWDRQEYGFRVDTERSLAIWKRSELPSLLGIDTQLVPTELSSMHGAAVPPPFSLDYVEWQLQFGGDIVRPGDQTKTGSLRSLEQTFWGRLYNGGYKVRLAQPNVSFDGEGIRVDDPEADPVQIAFADWKTRWPGGELTLGDTQIGLQSLVFPFADYTGVRIEEAVDADGNPLRSRGGPQRFDGVARVGSTVELIVNGQVVETDEVLADNPDAPPDFGLWEFEDVRLPGGARNDVRIRVTEPDGTVRQIDRSIIGQPGMLPRGAVSYEAGVGTRRTTQMLDAGGALLGGQLMYGLTDRFTLGLAMAYQDTYHQFLSPNTSRAQSSLHLGAQALWLPVDSLTVTAEAGWVDGEDPDGSGRNDVAGTLRADWRVAEQTAFTGALLYYGPDYFNGQSINPSDRMGYWIGGFSRLHRRLSASFTLGTVRDNVEFAEASTEVTRFQHARVVAQALRNASIAYSVDRIDPRGEDAALIHSLEFDATPLPNLVLSGTISRGDEQALADPNDVFTGLAIPGLDLGQTELTEVNARYSLASNHSVGARYFLTDTTEQVTLLHDLRTFAKPYLVLHTEIGADVDTDDVFFAQRTDLLLDEQGDWRLSLDARYDNDAWSVGLSVTIRDQLVVHGGGLTRPADLPEEGELYTGLIQPDLGGGVYGRVFIDADADGLLDPGEPGFHGVRVNIGQFEHATTDKAGFYVLPQLQDAQQVNVWLVLDTIPAIYSPTHGKQVAEVTSRSMTRVDLGISPSHSVSGRIIYVVDEQGGITGLGRARLQLVRAAADADEDRVEAESITASDGSYYFGDLRPGDYEIRVDPATLPPEVTVPASGRVVRIAPSIELQEVAVEPLVAEGVPLPERPSEPVESPTRPTPRVLDPTGQATDE